MNDDFLQQSKELQRLIDDWLSAENSYFMFYPQDLIADPLTNYLVYFCRLQASINKKNMSKTIRARWKFVNSWTANQYYQNSQVSVSGRLPWRGLCDALVWSSRERAIRYNSIDAHLSMSELQDRQVWKQPGGPNEKTLRDYIKERVEAGVYVKSLKATNRKEKWVSMGVSALKDYYIVGLGGFLVRASFRDGRYGTSPSDQKKYWVEKLGMPVEIWDYAMAQNWGIDDLI